MKCKLFIINYRLLVYAFFIVVIFAVFRTGWAHDPARRCDPEPRLKLRLERTDSSEEIGWPSEIEFLLWNEDASYIGNYDGEPISIRIIDPILPQYE